MNPNRILNISKTCNYAVIQTRFRSKPKISRPILRHMKRRVFDAVTKPIIMSDVVQKKFECNRSRNYQKKLQELNEVNEYEQFVIGKMQEMLGKSRYILVYQTFPFSMLDYMDLRRNLSDYNVEIHNMSANLFCKTVKDTVYEPLNVLYPKMVQNYLFSLLKYNLHDVICETNNTNKIFLVGGIIDNILLNANDIKAYAKHKSIIECQSNILNTTTYGIKQLFHNTMHHQLKLIKILNMRKDMM
ncbi:39S ribosomal protein L10, mitochondrial [Intoshia linei]|uniref:Large ribosomal subunit protein uL10m n=1 Tax=Intoshia linei TaxID=1819745 RepID=A0A177ARR1_9BILA|nr:39S ribosomal protein L10, mitochondrial [Intoshia linei]